MEIQNKKPFIAIETSGTMCSVALFWNEGEFIESNIHRKYSHSEKLPGMVEHICKQADLKINELRFIAISIGPGSFTGLRVGLSFIKGLAFGVNIPILPVPTFNAFGFEISKLNGNEFPFIIANKVNRDELYVQHFKNEKDFTSINNLVEIVNCDEFEKNNNSKIKVFGNNALSLNKFYSSPSAVTIADWADKFGQDLLHYNFDNLEPLYIKNFEVKVKK